MRSLATKQYGKPNGFEILDLPKPEIKNPDDVLIKVKATSINPIDLHVANGLGKGYIPGSLPFKIGYDVCGTVVATGTEVSSDIKQGDEVWARVPEEYRGTVSEYVISPAFATAHTPSSLSHLESASMPLVSLTALQVLDKANDIIEGGLEGKTLYIPAGLSGVGSAALQLAKRIFKAGKVITTLSTGKIAKIDGLIGEGVADQIVDYTKEDPGKVIPAGSVDFMFDITGQAMPSLHLMKKNGLILTINGIPFGESVKQRLPNLPLIPRLIFNTYGTVVQFRASRYGVKYFHVFVRPSAEDLTRLRGWVEQGLIKPVVGKVAKFEDIKAVREGCLEIASGKGGIGKFVIDLEA
ncbi:unnamed protein product [Clonostachys rosea]|uniref:Enoyl reductase (ER) domain-containing protein n=1 Tax=Bionectria ochroleuca TaxID=29856 RepID=A0ABY6UNS9_BIOOC|nr:unnamed protein product [Clonostachys rosea]